MQVTIKANFSGQDVPNFELGISTTDLYLIHEALKQVDPRKSQAPGAFTEIVTKIGELLELKTRK